MNKQNRAILSSAIALLSLGLAYVPLPGVNQTIVVVSGSELEEPLAKIETLFEEQNPNIDVQIKIQGSQDLVNNYIDDKNDFTPTVLIPASGEIIAELRQRWQGQNQTSPFSKPPQPIAKTFLVGIAWVKRGNVLFPQGNFDWERLELAMEAGNWDKIGGPSQWGSFDFMMTDPNRSNSGQLTLSLWTASKGNNLSNPKVVSLFKTVKSGVYQPPRSTDILLQEFIARGPNDADVATVYESIALYRWQQAGANQGKPYQIYYLDPTVETIATAAIVQRNVSKPEAKAGSKFVDFLREKEQQEIFIQYGFRPIQENIDLKSVYNSPWNQNIPGAALNPSVTIKPAPKEQEISEIQKLWQRN